MSAALFGPILLTGAQGQVGWELGKRLGAMGEVHALDRSKLDLCDLDAVRALVRELKPALIVNAAAYTAVDKAESDIEGAWRLNAELPGLLAEEALKLDAALVHYSTDYVFDGLGADGKGAPYRETDAARPLNVYGRSKLAGEQMIAASGCRQLALRTSWVYGLRGGNFLLTILKLAAERPELRIIDDQFGAPTWCATIAESTCEVLAQALDAGNAKAWWEEKGGLYHLAAAGETTWYGYAQAIFRNAALQKVPAVQPIPASEYPLPAKRPTSSRLDCGKFRQVFGLALPDWELALRACLANRI